MKKNLKSKVIHTSKRSYFFNLFEIDNGETMINIVESRKMGSNKYARKEIRIFKGDVQKFLEVVNDFASDI